MTYPHNRLYDRYFLRSLEDAFVIFPDFGQGSEPRRGLFNLSYKGIGFCPQPEDALTIPLLQILRGFLVLRDEKIPVEIEVIYVREDLGGARIQVRDAGDIRKIIRFLNPLDLGKSMQRVAPEFIRQTDPQLQMIWYAGKNNTEIMIWRDPKGEIQHFRMVFYLYALAGNAANKILKTADINPTEIGYLPIYEPWPEDLAHWHRDLNRDTLQLANEILEYATALDPQDRLEITQWILQP